MVLSGEGDEAEFRGVGGVGYEEESSREKYCGTCTEITVEGRHEVRKDEKKGAPTEGKPSLHSPITVAGSPVSALVDTGATSNFIQGDFQSALRKEKLMQGVKRWFTLGNGSTSPLKGHHRKNSHNDTSLLIL